ncbi:MAG: hypothetical protein HY708_00370 [Ignavibacteriae bacterium]|nr:hypothetical protein [Ignavibacteriota bacterium]
MTRNVCLLFMMAAVIASLFTACKEDQAAEPGKVTISGKISDALTAVPLPGVSVRAQTVTSAPQTTVTNAEGNYNFVFDVDSSTAVTISTSKTAYRDTVIVVQVQQGTAVPVNIQLNPRSVVSGGGGGTAQTIAFLGADPQEISVYGVGGQETSILGWEVRDSLGFPVDATHAVTLVFTTIGSLGGGEYISPPALTTNAVGRAFTTFNSGVVSGVVQIVASTTVGGRIISSSPVRVVINAGLPDQNHFSLGPERFNFPALGIIGKTDRISVLVGDKYSNPVVPNTAVYFRSDAGVIQASVFTDPSGLGTVTLFSGNPFPPNGYHYVVARTIGEGGVTVQDSIFLLWSGRAQVSPISPGTFSISNGSFQDFSFIVSDELGHPLAAGTTISVAATVSPPPDPLAPVNQVQLSFGIEGSVILEDVILAGPGTTDFTFRLSDGTISIDTLTAVSVAVSVVSLAGGNGSAYTSINGTVR